MPPFEYNKEGSFLAKVCKEMGLHPFPDTHASELGSLQWEARMYQEPYLLRLCLPVDAKNGTHNTVIPVAMQTGNAR
jgi:hypothetical protein